MKYMLFLRDLRQYKPPTYSSASEVACHLQSYPTNTLMRLLCVLCGPPLLEEVEVEV